MTHHPPDTTPSPTDRARRRRLTRMIATAIIVLAIGVPLTMLIRHNTTQRAQEQRPPNQIVQDHVAFELRQISTKNRAASVSDRPLPTRESPTALAHVTDPRLNEASGLIASRRNPGLYYTHNDSGGRPHVYVLNRSGEICMTIRLRGAKNVDWEDIALFPAKDPMLCEVCIADIGDNKARRAQVAFYRFAEPTIPASPSPDAILDITPTAIRCRYEDGPRDAEGFAIDPHTGDGYIFSKQLDGEPCRVYRLPGRWKTNGPTSLKYVTDLRLPPAPAPMTAVTAADISPDGQRLVTHSYFCGWEWQLPTTTKNGKPPELFAQTPRQLRLAAEQQGEAICFSPDGRHLLTISEGTPTALYEVPCADLAAP